MGQIVKFPRKALRHPDFLVAIDPQVRIWEIVHALSKAGFQLSTRPGRPPMIHRRSDERSC